MDSDAENPLVKALPPATDYLTYLTLLEYQLTPDRLPLLHRLLQDETLTTNIGWDLVKLLLPMLPASTDCLHDVARLGNPREVILRVSEALMNLQPEDEDEQDFDDDDDDNTGEENSLPMHIRQFNCLLAMLSELHTRIRTKAPSRFVANSLQAALEAYTSMPSDETTLALLEFLRDISPNKRPAPPPRSNSQSAVVRVNSISGSAPDPEAEVALPRPAADHESVLVEKFIQFGLIEVLKAYLLSHSSPMDPGLSWTVRMQEHFHPQLKLPENSQTEAYVSTKELKERDMIMGKIVALSRDVGIETSDLLDIISKSPEDQPQPLDFEDTPSSADQIPLERHGSLLLLAARTAGSTLFASGQSIPKTPIFPNLALIYKNFLGVTDTSDQVALGQPQALIDSLLALTVFSLQESTTLPSSETEFKDFLVALTGCTSNKDYGIVRNIPAELVHSNESAITRFKLIRTILEDGHLQSARDSAISWLKDEILKAPCSDTIFRDPLHFWTLFPLLFQSVQPASSIRLIDSFISLTQTDGPALHSALNLYLCLLLSPHRDQLQLEKTVSFFRSQVLDPLRVLFHTFEADLNAKGGEGIIENFIGEEMTQIGLSRSVGLMGLTLYQIEDAISEAFGTDEADLAKYSAEDEAKVEEIRQETQNWN